MTEQDFQDISNVTGHIFAIGVQRSGGSVSTVVCPNSEFLEQDLKGKHSWLNACSAKELSERVRHVLSACVASPLTTSVCVLTRQSMPIDMSLLKDFRCVLTVPREVLSVSSKRMAPGQSCEVLNVCESCIVPLLQIVYPLRQGCLRAKFSLLLQQKPGPDAQNRYSRMMFAGRAALLRLTPCLILVRLLTSCPSRSRSRRVSR
jgi:hypothetical protein